MTLAADEFIRRFLLHALPRGFHRIRHYGLLASAHRKDHLERARRPFERRFQRADYVEVGSASFADGLLAIELKRVIPEAMKPRKIEIGSTEPRRIGSSKEKTLENA